jgi:hypothetical protein
MSRVLLLANAILVVLTSPAARTDNAEATACD